MLFGATPFANSPFADPGGVTAKEDFKKNGGNELHVIPCLNVREDWVNTLVNWIKYWHKTPKN